VFVVVGAGRAAASSSVLYYNSVRKDGICLVFGCAAAPSVMQLEQTASGLSSVDRWLVSYKEET